MKTTINKKLKYSLRILIICLLVVFIIFCLSMYFISTKKSSKILDINNTDVIIVLGSGLCGDKVSPQLSLRLKTTYALIKENANLSIIVSGG